jgi:signal peptidase
MTTILVPLRPRRIRTATVRPGRHRVASRSVWGRLVSLLTTLLFVTALLALLGMTVGPRVFGYRTATMLTGSMAPGIEPGDVVVDTSEPVSAVAVGQIITYHIPVEDHRVESHRVVWMGHDSTGHVLIKTKGDANPIADPWTARLGDGPVWRVRGVVPLAGKAIRTLREPLVHTALMLVLPGVLVIGLLVAIWSPAETDESSGEPDTKKHKQKR